MRGHLHLTPLGGVAGDMFVASLLHAFPDLAAPVLAATGNVLPGANAMLHPCTKGGLAARRFVVPGQGQAAPIHYPDMDAMLCTLEERTRNHARAMLRLLAGAEADVHGIPLDRVHFHEIADWDTLADLTAAATLLAHLDGWTWSLDPLPLGAGRVQTAHGALPVPTPATAHLLRGLAVCDDAIPGERVTPTGAAIVRHIADTLPVRPRPMGRLGATGYGAGARDLPGVANVTVVQAITGAVQGGDSVAVLEWDIDDMTGEEIARAADHLRACDGVLDVVTMPLIGKKGRGATGFRMLVRPGQADAAAVAVFAQTTTLGLRLRHEARLVLPRSNVDGGKRTIRPGAETVKADSDSLTADTLAGRRALARGVEG